MKYLKDYYDTKLSKLFKDNGAFFAFGEDQFKKAAKLPREEYVSLRIGLICPKVKAKQFIIDMDLLFAEAIQEDIAENGLETIVLRELNNHECYYTNDIEPCVDALTGYGVSHDIVWELFKNDNYKIPK